MAVGHGNAHTRVALIDVVLLAALAPMVLWISVCTLGCCSEQGPAVTLNSSQEMDVGVVQEAVTPRLSAPTTGPAQTWPFGLG